jgi:hypothetical protein
MKNFHKIQKKKHKFLKDYLKNKFTKKMIVHSLVNHLIIAILANLYP